MRAHVGRKQRPPFQHVHRSTTTPFLLYLPHRQLRLALHKLFLCRSQITFTKSPGEQLAPRCVLLRIRHGEHLGRVKGRKFRVPLCLVEARADLVDLLECVWVGDCSDVHC